MVPGSYIPWSIDFHAAVLYVTNLGPSGNGPRIDVELFVGIASSAVWEKTKLPTN